MNKTHISVALVLLAVIAGGCKRDNSFDAEFERATKVIAQRDTWPESPEQVSKAFWDARYKKDYSEMHILWPGSASFDWPATCAKDSSIRYMFGTARTFTSYQNNKPVDEAEVPYASEEYFKKNASYDLTMRLQALNTERGKRWYVYSGN